MGFVGTPVSVCLRFWASSVTVVAFQVCVHVCVIHLSLSLHTLYTVSLSEMWASLVHLYHQSVLDFGLRHVCSVIFDSIFHYSKFFKAPSHFSCGETGIEAIFLHTYRCVVLYTLFNFMYLAVLFVGLKCNKA